MPDPSSTSSSEPGRTRRGAPWAALLAALLVFAADRTVLSDVDLWRAIERRLEGLPKRLVRVEVGIARDRLELARLDQAAPGVKRVVAMGNSRALAGMQFGAVPGSLRIASVRHAPISPLELRLFAREALSHRVDLFVVMLSEFDTQRPVCIVPRAGFADLRATVGIALSALASRSGWTPSFLLLMRVELERLALAAVLDAYRYRDALHRAWLDERFGFPPDEGGRLPALVSRDVDEDEETAEIPDIEAVRARFGPKPRGMPNNYVNMLRSTRVAEYTAANEDLVEGAIEVLRPAGCEVLLVEGPLHPVAYELYDRAATRGEFLAFVHRLEREHGVHFLALEETGPFPADDFNDPLHLKERRGEVLGALVLRRVEEILRARP
jgi:hypothetical protein